VRSCGSRPLRLYPPSNIAEDATAATGLAKHSSRAYCKRPGVTLLLLWEEYRGPHPDGLGYSRFCEIYPEWKGRLTPTMRQTHIAGERMFVDYSGKKPHLINPTTGELMPVELSVAVVGAP
jgi:transposase